MASRSQIWPAAGRPAVRWRNGGGITREVARSPADPEQVEFDWRVSLAEVEASGPFSTFADVDRTIVLIDGAAMTLNIDGVRHDLRRYDPLSFDGASSTYCEVPAGPTRDLNVMTRRGRVTALVELLDIPQPAEPHSAAAISADGTDALLLIAITGSLTVTSAHGIEAVLAPLDALQVSTPRGPDRRPPPLLQLTGPGVAAVVRFVRPG